MQAGRPVVIAVLVAMPAAAMMAQQGKAADAIVRSPTSVMLEIPPRDTTFQTIQQVLQMADVRHGIEQAPPTAETAQIDFGRRPDGTVILDGITVREALDRIVREDPRYEWGESDGRILVRTIGTRGSGALDARVAQFAVTNVSFIDALAALVHAIDPLRPAPAVIQFGLTLEIGGSEARPGITRPAGTEPRAAGPRNADGQKLITLALGEATVLEALDAIARAHGELSWSVHYDVGGERFENATISLTGRTLSARAVSANAEREAIRMRDRHRIMIPVIGPLDRMLMLYVKRARIQMGIELLPENGRPVVSRCASAGSHRCSARCGALADPGVRFPIRCGRFRRDLQPASEAGACRAGINPGSASRHILGG